MRSQSEAALIRAVGTRGLAAMIVNIIVGAGIFALPAAVAADVGAAAPVAYIVCAIIMGLVALCFAAAGSRVARSGGPYMYVEAAFGPRAGFVIGVLLWLSNILGGAGVAAALADVLGAMHHVFTLPWVRAALLIAIFVAIATVHVRGIRTGTRLVEVTTVLKLAPLVLFVLVGAFFVRPEHLRWTDTPGLGDIGRTVMLVIFAFSGMEVALGPSGEVRDPARTVPRALLAALTLVVVLYIAIQLVAQGILGSELADSKAALSDASRHIAPGAAAFIAIGALVSMFGGVAGETLGSSRLLFAFARDGMLPAWLATIHPRFRTPHVTVALHAALACTLALSGTFVQLAILSTVALVVIYLACCAAAWALERSHVRADGAPFVLPGGALIPVLASLALLWVLSRSTVAEIGVVVGTIGVALLLYQASRVRPLQDIPAPTGESAPVHPEGSGHGQV
jgi:amino acid transporter